MVATGSQLGENVGNDLSKCMTKFDDKKVRLRRAFSLEEISEHAGEEDEEEEPKDKFPRVSPTEDMGFIIDPETGKGRHMRRYSFPMSPRTLAGVPRTDFANQLKGIRDNQMEDLDNNVYAQAKPPAKDKEIKRKKMVSRRT